jgi:hypothetical protein
MARDRGSQIDQAGDEEEYQCRQNVVAGGDEDARANLFSGNFRAVARK